MSSSPNSICMTRAIKNLKFIERSMPNITSKDLEELMNLPPEILQTLHTRSNFQEIIFCNVTGTNWTMGDNASNYAAVLSHEIAEMVVDPAANDRNPEVCDGCAGNCDTFWIDCFDNNAKFVGGSQTIPPSFGYSFFINSIIKPDAIDPTSPKFCAIPQIGAQNACVYDIEAGPVQVQVPWVINDRADAASSTIKSVGLVPVPDYSNNHHTNKYVQYVQGTNPDPDTLVARGTPVSMTLVEGPPP